MDFSFTSLFHRSFGKLAKDQQERIDEAIELLVANPHHPFPHQLRVHKLKGVFGTPENEGDSRPPVWEMHASGPILVTFQYGDEEILFRDCGPHDQVLRKP